MITVRCPQCSRKLTFAPFPNYRKAALECPSCHYRGLVETFPEEKEKATPAQPERPKAPRQRPQARRHEVPDDMRQAPLTGGGWVDRIGQLYPYLILGVLAVIALALLYLWIFTHNEHVT